MVSGIDTFRRHFSDFKEQYTVIGGFACDLLMTGAGLDLFRLFPLVREDQRIVVPESIGADIQSFISRIQETDIRLTDIGISRSKESILEIYRNMFVTN